jgi:hypothetical protein
MKVVGCVFFFIFLFSCTDKTSVPSNIIPREKMENVLWDMIVADRYAYQVLIRDSLKLDVKQKTQELYSQVLRVHSVKDDEFITSFKFYMSRPDLIRNIFDTLSAKANRMRAEVYKPITKPAGRLEIPKALLK